MSSVVEDDAMPVVGRNNRHKNIIECMNECKSALNEMGNKVDIRGKCTKFRSDYFSTNGFKESDVKDFARKFNVIKIDDILPVIDKDVNMRDVEDSKKYDSMWKSVTCGKTFKTERFFYCRVYNGNDRSIEVVMIWIYLEAPLQHQTTITQRINLVFSTISDQASEIVGRALANIIEPSLQKNSDKICHTSSRMTDDLINRLPQEQTLSTLYNMFIVIAVVVFAISFVLFFPRLASKT